MTFNRFFVGSKYPYFIPYRGKWLYLFCRGCTYLEGLTSKTCIHSKSDKLSHSKVFLSTRITHFLSNTSQLCQENEVVLRGNLLPLKNDEKPLQPYVIGPTSKAIFLANKVHYTNPLKIQPITPFSISSIPLTKLDWRYSDSLFSKGYFSKGNFNYSKKILVIRTFIWKVPRS